MTYWNYGSLYTGGLSEEETAKVEAVLKDHGFVEFNGPAFLNLGNGLLELIDGYPGDIENDLTSAMEELRNVGILVNGRIRYSGDYDGFYDIKDSMVTLHDIEEMSLLDADVEKLVEMLRCRGYSVELDENKKTVVATEQVSIPRLYVYKEYCDEDAYGEEIIELYEDREDAIRHLREQVEAFFDCDFEDVSYMDEDTVQPDYVSISNGDCCHFFMVKDHAVHLSQRSAG